MRLKRTSRVLRRQAITVCAIILMYIAQPFAAAKAQTAQPEWSSVEEETMRRYQALLRFDTTAKERPAAEYIKQALDENGIHAQIYAADPDRPNVVARLKGNGKKRPLLLMGHTDVVPVDASKWRFPPFSATRDSGWVYGRGALDDKSHVVAGLMTMLLLKRLNVPLDRDVILLNEAAEENGAEKMRVGINYMIEQHFPEIDAEYCFAEGGAVTREHGAVQYAATGTTEKVAHGVELVAHGTAGHGSIPLKSNAIVHLAAAVARIGDWRPDIKLNETTTTYFGKLAEIAPPEEAKYYRDILSADPNVRRSADNWLLEHLPKEDSMLRTSVSPTIIQGGYRSNVIPSEAKATLDVRMVPDEDPAAFLAELKKVVNDASIDVHFTGKVLDVGKTPVSRIDTEAFRAIEAAVTKVYNTVTLPRMVTAASDMAFLRARGMQCYGTGVATDIEDQPLGYGAHSDQERLRESELHRFVRFNWELVSSLAWAK